MTSHQRYCYITWFLRLLNFRTETNGFTDERQELKWYVGNDLIAESKCAHITITPKFKELVILHLRKMADTRERGQLESGEIPFFLIEIAVNAVEMMSYE